MMIKNKRNTIEILRDILSSISESGVRGYTKSQVNRKANVTIPFSQQYYSFIISRGIAKEHKVDESNRITLTEKGKDFLIRLDKTLQEIDDMTKGFFKEAYK